MIKEIYLINDPSLNRYKIGISKNARNRIKELQTGNSTKLELISVYQSDIYFKIEKSLHRRYKQYNTCGEWFSLPYNEVSSFVDNCSKLESNIKYLIDNDNPFI